MSSVVRKTDSTTQAENTIDSMSCIRTTWNMYDLSEETVQLLSESWSIGTRKQYLPYIKKFFTFCFTRTVDPFHATPDEVAEFLTELFHKTNNQYNVFNTARSAISAIVQPVNNVTVGNHPLIK